MKRTILSVVVIAGLAIGGYAFARGGGMMSGGYGYGMSGGNGYYAMMGGQGGGYGMMGGQGGGGYGMMGGQGGGGYGMQGGQGYGNSGDRGYRGNGSDSGNQAPPASGTRTMTNRQNQKFLNATVAQRKKLNELRFEYGEALRNPNTTAADKAKLEREMNNLQEQINERARQFEQ